MPAPELQMDEVPVIDPAAPGAKFMDIGKLAEAVPAPHVLEGVTFNVPAVALAEKLAVMEFVFPGAENPLPV